MTDETTLTAEDRQLVSAWAKEEWRNDVAAALVPIIRRLDRELVAARRERDEWAALRSRHPRLSLEVQEGYDPVDYEPVEPPVLRNAATREAVRRGQEEVYRPTPPVEPVCAHVRHPSFPGQCRICGGAMPTHARALLARIGGSHDTREA